MAIGPGTRLGGYEVLSQLGAGGMGEVFRARDTTSAARTWTRITTSVQTAGGFS